jgi:hypothetical protein
MYTFMRNVRLREGVLVEVPALVLSFATAELFYKFHSFTLECACFLGTWLAASSLFSFLFRRLPDPVLFANTNHRETHE